MSRIETGLIEPSQLGIARVMSVIMRDFPTPTNDEIVSEYGKRAIERNKMFETKPEKMELFEQELTKIQKNLYSDMNTDHRGSKTEIYPSSGLKSEDGEEFLAYIKEKLQQPKSIIKSIDLSYGHEGLEPYIFSIFIKF